LLLPVKQKGKFSLQISNFSLQSKHRILKLIRAVGKTNTMALFVARGNVGRFCFMASRGGKLVTPFGISSKTCKMAGPCSVQIALITAPANQPIKVEKPKPWPYKTFNYNSFWQIFDRTYKRIDENSKVICVEGNMAVGKTDFAKTLAEELDFHYVPMTAHDALFWDPQKRFHLSELNQALPEKYKIFDLEQFYRQKNPESGRAGFLQLTWFRQRVFDYAEGLQHLFNTGKFQQVTLESLLTVSPHKLIAHLTVLQFKYFNFNSFRASCA
jgi:hypothetical protein